MSASQPTPVLGANLNGRPHRLLEHLDLVDVSDTTWVRAFIDVRRKLQIDGDPATDPDVVALRRLARRKGCNLVVSLKWDFAANWGDKPTATVPEPGSARERALLRCAVDHLEAIGAPVDVVVLGNEPLWETLDEDLQVDDPPIVRFTQRLKHFLVEDYDGEPTLLAGAFNRLDDATIRQRRFPAFHEAMFDLIRRDDAVAGADLHVHFDTLDGAAAMLEAARSALPEGLLAVTEFSPVWRYERNLDVPIGRSAAGRRFAETYGISPETTPLEYIETAKADPLSAEELAAFMDAVPWYNVDHVADVYDRLAEYGVSLGTFGFLQDVGMRREDWSADWTPFHINFLLQRALLDGEYGGHPHYLADYRERTGDGDSTLL